MEADLLDLFPLELDLALPPLVLSDDLLLPPLVLSDDLDLLFFAGGDLEDLLPAPDLPVLLLLLLLRTGVAPLLGEDRAPAFPRDDDLALPLRTGVVVLPVGDVARLPGEDRAVVLLWDGDLLLPPRLDDDLALPEG